jgi:hypothetical protein
MDWLSNWNSISMNKADFFENGFGIVSPFLNPKECSFYETAVSEINSKSVGTVILPEQLGLKSRIKRPWPTAALV